MVAKEKVANILYFILVLALAAFIYLWYKTPHKTPYQVLTPSTYATGTVVSLYKENPPGFPEVVILANKGLDYSGIVETPEGKSTWTVSYISEESLSTMSNAYLTHLADLGWETNVQSASLQVVSVKATKGDETILLTIAPLPNNGGLMVTLQYESR